MNKDNEISLDQGKRWTTLWREASPDHCKAFLIPVSDLVGILEEMEVLQKVKGEYYIIKEGHDKGIRAYMGIDPKEKMGGGEKLVLVGTKKEIDKEGRIVHRDIINEQIAAAESENSGIYDFTEPCPDACDGESPLNGV